MLFYLLLGQRSNVQMGVAITELSSEELEAPLPFQSAKEPAVPVADVTDDMVQNCLHTAHEKISHSIKTAQESMKKECRKKHMPRAISAVQARRNGSFRNFIRKDRKAK